MRRKAFDDNTATQTYSILHCCTLFNSHHDCRGVTGQTASELEVRYGKTSAHAPSDFKVNAVAKIKTSTDFKQTPVDFVKKHRRVFQ